MPGVVTLQPTSGIVALRLDADSTVARRVRELVAADDSEPPNPLSTRRGYLRFTLHRVTVPHKRRHT